MKRKQTTTKVSYLWKAMLSIFLFIILLPGFFPFLFILISTVILSLFQVNISTNQLWALSISAVTSNIYIQIGIIVAGTLAILSYIAIELYQRYIRKGKPIYYLLYMKVKFFYTKFDHK